MARKGLTDRVVKQAKKPGVFIDGGGLRLKITLNEATKTLRKSWVLRVKVKDGATREMGLGSVETLSLEDARDQARHLRKLARSGFDPIAHRAAERVAKSAEAARALTFQECAATYISTHRASWKNEKHAKQWPATLKSYAYPVFGKVSVGEVDQAMVMKVLDPIWATKTETAARLRGRIEAVLDWATVRGYRTGENPARWRGHLQRALPPRSKTQRVKHHPALPYAELPAFMSALRALDGLAARALEFCVLTATRSSETLNARWSEIDLEDAVWTIPGERMKMGRAHRVPLSRGAVRLLRDLQSKRGKGDWVFPGAKDGQPLSNMAMLMTLRRMKRTDLVTHGFRSTFRDWAAEQTAFAREVAEAALAHAIGDKVEAAYRRGDLFEKRRKLMDDWSAYCAAPRSQRSKVVALQALRTAES